MHCQDKLTPQALSPCLWYNWRVTKLLIWPKLLERSGRSERALRSGSRLSMLTLGSGQIAFLGNRPFAFPPSFWLPCYFGIKLETQGSRVHLQTGAQFSCPVANYFYSYVLILGIFFCKLILVSNSLCSIQIFLLWVNFLILHKSVLLRWSSLSYHSYEIIFRICVHNVPSIDWETF